jgi:hypothetical protein
MPRNGTIRRSALVQAVEAGISAARTLTPVEKLALRLVAAVETEVTIGNFDSCPLTVAGVYEAALAEHDENHLQALSRFYGAFDRVADAAMRSDFATYLTVID